MDCSYIVSGYCVDSLQLASYHILSEDHISDSEHLLVGAAVAERHDAQFKILVDSDSFLAGFHVVLIDGGDVEDSELLVVDVLVDVLVAEGSSLPVYEYCSQLLH